MLQILQNLRTGTTFLEEVPLPSVGTKSVLIRTHRTLVSLGTERMLVEFGRSNLISKARQQPDKVKMVLDKMKADGVMPTLEAVFNKLDEPLPLGYCNAGEVIALGKGLEGGDLKIGDRVVSNGPHAEIVSVPKNLVARIPDRVTYEEAAFTVVASIGLQGVRIANPVLGETVVVTGLGLIGLLTAELLLASGCRVIGFDFDVSKVEAAKRKGVDAVALSSNDDPVGIVTDLTAGIGADAVLITASAKSNEIVSQAARMSRKRGRIILVGVVGLELNRSEFYEKELSFQVSCSYGPGRYDESYEGKGQDYPLPFVRWTENRNFQAVLQAMASKRLDVTPLISEIVEFTDFDKVYGSLGSSGKIASLLRYSAEPSVARTVSVGEQGFAATTGALALIGAGNFSKMTVLPALRKSSMPVRTIVSSGGVTGTSLARKYGIPESTTDYEKVLQDPGIAGVIITTRHNIHARMALQALRAGKHVLLEKPLCLTREELEEIRSFFSSATNQEPGTRNREATTNNQQPSTNNPLPTLTVGFNRRFSPHVLRMKELLGNTPGLINVTATFNVGAIPADHWVHDPIIGGGRIIGEACHFIDLITFLTGSRIEKVCASGMGKDLSVITDNASILLKFENGSHGVVNYFANGNKSCSKERVEVYSQGRNLILDNFRDLRGFGFKGFSRLKIRQDKGHRKQFQLYAERVREGGQPLIPLAEILDTTDAGFAAVESMLSGEWITLVRSSGLRAASEADNHKEHKKGEEFKHG